VVRPIAVETVTLGLETFTLPAGLAADATLVVGHLATVTVVGGAGGLYELGSGGLSQLDAVPVKAIAVLDDGTMAVANAAGISIFDGTLRSSPLTTELDGHGVTTLAARDGELWIGTDAGLYRWSGGNLVSFEGMQAVRTIDTYDGAPAIVVGEGTGSHKALRFDASSWSAQVLDDERQLDRGVPGPGGRIFGLVAGALLERVTLEGNKVAWRAVALAAGADAPGATGIQAVAVDPGSGAIWFADAAELSRIDTAAGRVSKIARPSGFGAVIAARVTKDGALWISDGTTLARVGNAGDPVAFEPAIANFASENCLRCHAAANGIARPSLDLYADWVTNIDKIITALEQERMPADRQPLRGGTIDLIRRWRDDGLRQ
jgi:hypothetical protein